MWVHLSRGNTADGLCKQKKILKWQVEKRPKQNKIKKRFYKQEFWLILPFFYPLLSYYIASRKRPRRGFFWKGYLDGAANGECRLIDEINAFSHLWAMNYLLFKPRKDKERVFPAEKKRSIGFYLRLRSKKEKKRKEESYLFWKVVQTFVILPPRNLGRRSGADRLTSQLVLSVCR